MKRWKNFTANSPEVNRIRNEIHLASVSLIILWTGWLLQLPEGTLQSWILLGLAASLLVDLDHLLLFLAFGSGKPDLSSLRLEKMLHYENLETHRLYTHTAALILSGLALIANPFFTPVFLALTVHVGQDWLATLR